MDSTIITIDATYTCKVSFDNSNEYFYESTAYIEVITITAVDAATVGGVGSSATVSCKVDGSSDKEWDSIKWYNGAGEISASPFTVTDPSSFAADSTSTLATSEPTADATYTCTVKYQSDGTNDISVSVVLDFVGKYIFIKCIDDLSNRCLIRINKNMFFVILNQKKRILIIVLVF